MNISDKERQRATNWTARQAHVSEALSLVEAASTSAVALLAIAAWLVTV